MQFSTQYIFFFATALCLVCSTAISIAAVSLKERQEFNQQLDRQKSVLLASRIMSPDDNFSVQEIQQRFDAIASRVVDLETGEYDDSVDAAQWTMGSAPKQKAPTNNAGIQEIPANAPVFLVEENGELDMIVLPIHGQGLWGMLWGYIALDKDTTTIRGITYYEHKETPGLGGEVDNPSWKNRWPGRKAFDEDWDVAIEVIKGAAPPPDQAPHSVDGLSGATITARGVTNMLNFWLGANGFGPFLENLREGRI